VQRFARGVHQPLLAFSSSADRPLPEPVLKLDDNAVVATCLKPARDARGLIIRLFNTTGEEQQVALQTRKDATSIWLSNPLEEKLSAAPARLALEKYEIVTLRIE